MNTAAAGNDRMAMSVLTATVFMGAILLFGLEPLAGRMLTPYFGGAAHVWLTCLMFFQAVLFVGYLYAHLFARKLGVWHLAILALPLVNLPLQVSAQPDPHAPLTHLLYVLSVYVALPFAESDPLYGSGAGGREVTLGNLALRGERGAIRIPAAAMLRQRWNPFYPLLEKRAIEFTRL